MSGNKLLAESTIRRFMKLASVDAMTDGFISEMGMKYRKEEEIEEEVADDEDEVNEEIDALYEEEDELDDMAMDAPEEEEELMQEALVNEVLKRVTKRIVAAKLKNRK